MTNHNGIANQVESANLAKRRFHVDHFNYLSSYPTLTEEIKSLLHWENHSPYLPKSSLLKLVASTSNASFAGTRDPLYHGKYTHAQPQQMTIQEVFIAIIDNDLLKLEELLLRHKKGAFDINEAFLWGLRPIHVAAQLGLGEVLDLLRVNGAAFCTEKSPVHPIFVAAAHQNYEIVKQLIEDYGVDPNTRGPKGETVLHVAVVTHQTELLKYLLLYDTKPDISDEEGYSPVLLAVLKNDLQMFNILKEYYVEMGSRSKNGQYVFHLMSMHSQFMSKLKKYRAFYTVSDFKDRTCLHYAIIGGNLKATKEILKHGIHQLDLQTAERHTAVTLACAAAQGEILDFLLTKYYSGKRPITPYETPFKDIQQPIHVCAESGNLHTMKILEKHGLFDINDKTTKRCFTPAHISCYSENTEVAKYLIEKRADLVVRDGKGWFPIHYSAQNQMTEVTKLMLPSYSPAEFMSGTTPLHLACKNGCYEIVEDLLKANHDPTVADKLGYAAIHYSASRGYIEILKILLEYNAKIHRMSSFSETPLFLACINGHPGVVKKLKEAGANINIPNQEGKKAFHEACRRGHVRVVEVVLEQPRMKLDINGLSPDGTAALHVACANGQFDVAGLLLREGADMSCIDANGMTAMHHAAANGHMRIIESLIQVGSRWKMKDDNELTPADHASKHKHHDVALFLNSLKPLRQVILERSTAGDYKHGSSEKGKKHRRSSSKVSFT